MAKNQSRSLPLKRLNSDKETFDALKAIGNYSPQKSELSVARIQALHDNMVALRTKATQAEAQYNSALDNATEAEWAFHNAILNSKDQVVAQFGKDSNEVQAVGLKKVSEYKTRRLKPAAAKTK
ncbi:MAG: hypothetical protein JSS79_16430 [Bacteroidetes bacterium]|nr:hypothetical protein [Bacteroidota bacterium]